MRIFGLVAASAACVSLCMSAKLDVDLAEALHKSTVEVDLVHEVSRRHVRDTVSFQNALSTIEKLQRASSCHRLAGASLINSCRTLEGEDSQRFVALERLESVFGARLAICELVEAHASVPDACQHLVPKQRNRSRQFRLFGYKRDLDDDGLDSGSAFHYEKPSEGAVTQCLSALESRPQWWMSYSNGRQNAISICYATRSEVDRGGSLLMHIEEDGNEHWLTVLKEDLLKLYKHLAESLSDMHGTLVNAIDEAFAQGSKRFSDATSTASTALRDMTSSAMHVVQDVSAMVHKTCQNMSSLRDRQQFTQLSDLGRSLGRSNEDIKNSIARLNSTLDSSLDSWTKKSELGNELAGQAAEKLGALIAQTEMLNEGVAASLNKVSNLHSLLDGSFSNKVLMVLFAFFAASGMDRGRMLIVAGIAATWLLSGNYDWIHQAASALPEIELEGRSLPLLMALGASIAGAGIIITILLTRLLRPRPTQLGEKHP